jgi:hypothetical protein
MITVVNVVLLVMALVVVFYGVKLLLNRGA